MDTGGRPSGYPAGRCMDAGLVLAAFTAVRLKQGKRPHGFALPETCTALASTVVAILCAALLAGLLAERALGSRPGPVCVPTDVACTCWRPEPLVLKPIASDLNFDPDLLRNASATSGVIFLGDANTGAMRLSAPEPLSAPAGGAR